MAWLRVRARENGLLDIGYHFVIERDGRVIMTRPVGRMGSHTPGCNHDSIGVCLAMDGDFYPEPPQVISLARLVAELGPDLPILGASEVCRYRDKRPSLFSMGQLREDIHSIMNDYTDSVSKPGAKEGGADDRALYEAGLPGDLGVDTSTGNTEFTQGEGVIPAPGPQLTLSQQQQLVLEYLQSGRALTNLIAISNLGVGSLSSRIAELRAMGTAITGTPKYDFNGRRYMSYTLDGASQAS
ncbi:hypothetical protein M2322_002664 [Rhodoblastus acidophilus]|nr:hypothetical protein [Rhodoblastus acidophilus]